MQYGPCPGKMCLTPVLNKQLTHDLFWQTKKTGTILDNDTNGAFDRMIQALALLILRCFGFLTTAIKELGMAWNKILHQVKTAHEASHQTYGSTSETPLFGAGQGGCQGPFL